MAVFFYEEGVRARLKDRLRLKRFLKDNIVARYLPTVSKMDVTYIFCDDAYLLQINQDFLRHDTYTDIITFDLSEEAQHLQAEIYISVTRIAENAQQFNTSYERELHRVIFHGLLHLCGFKDKTKKDAALMRGGEEECLTQYFDNEA